MVDYFAGLAQLKDILGEAWSDDIVDILRALRPKTYIGDICTRCGKMVKHDQP